MRELQASRKGQKVASWRKGQRVSVILQGFKVYVIADRLYFWHNCPKRQRVSVILQGFKVYAIADRLCFWHYCPKKAKGYTKIKGFRVSAFVLWLRYDDTPKKGKGLRHFAPTHCPHCAVRCCRACMKMVMEDFHHYFHTCPYL